MEVRNLSFSKLGRNIALISGGGGKPGGNSALDKREHLKKQRVVKVRTEKYPFA